ncbi:DNA circularization N-terminal domain-containing protein [Bradyrhizobium cenepequi]
MASFPPSVSPVLAVRPQAQAARDWLRTLWPASYKGVPFFVERDWESGSRRIVEHEFPMRDIPYLEDLGEGVRRYDVTAYVASDAADADAASVIAVCATRGPGSLVLPTHGPVIVRCLTFERARKKDQHGYIAIDMRFTREGAASALVSVANLANLVFVSAEAAALQAALSFAQATVTAAQPDYVVEAAVSGVQDNASALEVLRTSASVDPTVSAVQAVEIQSIFDAAPTITETPVVGAGVYVTQAGEDSNSPAVDLGARIVASARALSAGLPATNAVAQFEEMFTSAQVEVDAPAYPTPSTVLEAANAAAAMQLLRMSALISYAEAIARVTLTDRPSAITLRANVAEHFEGELLVVNAADIALAKAIMSLRDSVIDYLSRAVLDLAPVITVEANLVMPSLFWAFKLYQDPTRALEIAARNQLAHPSFIPTEFEALAR